MNYVISDLHGQFDSYEKLLSKIKFKDEDTLYLLGDIIDYGNDGIQILLDAMGRSNVYPILGDHEYMAVRLLTKLRLQEQGKKEPTEKFQKEFAAWLHMGATPTVQAFRELDSEQQEDILAYLREECVPYELVKTGHKRFLLVHAGCPADASEETLDNIPVDALINAKPEFPAKAPAGMILVTGHVPTEKLDEAEGGRALISPHHIAIDCGAEDGGFACCLCLENGKCFYA